MNINNIVEKIKKQINYDCPVGLIFGSGIDVSKLIKNPLVISYDELGMPQSKVSGHGKRFVFGEINGIKVILASRYHYYESGDMERVRLPFLIMKELGVKNVILQTSVGGINESLHSGEICLISDHINFTGQNPLIGCEPLCFTNMSNNYNSEYIDYVQNHIVNLPVVKHIQFTGPSYETLAEINMIKKLGADTVSMSMAYDNIICRYLNIDVIAFAVVTNMLGLDSIKTLSHNEVLETALTANIKMQEIIKKIFESRMF